MGSGTGGQLTEDGQAQAAGQVQGGRAEGCARGGGCRGLEHLLLVTGVGGGRGHEGENVSEHVRGVAGEGGGLHACGQTSYRVLLLLLLL